MHYTKMANDKHYMTDYQSRPGQSLEGLDKAAPQQDYSKGVNAMSGQGKGYGGGPVVGHSGKMGACGTSPVKRHHW